MSLFIFSADLDSPASFLLQQDEVISWRELLEMGDSVPEEALDAVEESQYVNDACMLVYTSGIKKC